MALAYGPGNAEWRDRFLRWTCAFPHLARHSLRSEKNLSDLRELLEADDLSRLRQAEHAPLTASLQIARLLQDAVAREQMDRFAFLQCEQQRCSLIDHLGACERILKTPLARVVSIKVRRFLFLYLSVLPIGIVDRCGVVTPFLTMLVAYPLLSLDQIGIELENPFSTKRLSHLPLDQIGDTIEQNVLRLADGTPASDLHRSPARHTTFPPAPRVAG
jgi:putative membrane protein